MRHFSNCDHNVQLYYRLWSIAIPLCLVTKKPLTSTESFAQFTAMKTSMSNGNVVFCIKAICIKRPVVCILWFVSAKAHKDFMKTDIAIAFLMHRQCDMYSDLWFITLKKNIFDCPNGPFTIRSVQKVTHIYILFTEMVR